MEVKTKLFFSCLKEPCLVLQLVAACFGLLLTNSSVCLAQDAKSQDSLLSQRVSLAVSDMPMREVLAKLGDETNADFAYFDRPELSEKVSMEIEGQELGKVLHRLLDETGMGFTVRGERIIVKKKERSPLF